MIYKCAKCFHLNVVGINDFISEITCGNCKRQICGMCLQRCHYPALCYEFERLGKRPIIVNKRLAQYAAVHWNHQNMALHWLINMQTVYEGFSLESHERFHKRLLLPFKQMREVVEFNRWCRLHAAFNPMVEYALANEQNLLETRINAFFNCIPAPGVAKNVWIASLPQIRVTSIDVCEAVTKLILGIPDAHHIAEVQDARKGVDYWSTKMVG